MQFFATPPHTCSYLPGREAVNVFADPYSSMHMQLYGRLIDHGFRRSGRHVYRPHCEGCRACVATRIPVSRFSPDRSQRRNLALNAGLEARILDAAFNEEHFSLYRDYVNTRHAGGEMENPTPESYRAFLRANWSETRFVEFREQGRLLCVAAIDCFNHGFSAVYTFYDPRYPKRGFGVYAVLWQIEEARRRGLPYVYLGYWIAGHSKMGYKSRFKPIEGLIDGRWQALSEAFVAFPAGSQRHPGFQSAAAGSCR